jgi:hypothetical protein
MLSNLPLIIRASDAEHPPPLYHNTPIHTYDRKGAWGFHLRFCIDTTIPGLYFGKCCQSAAGYTTVLIKSIAESLRFGFGGVQRVRDFGGWLLLTLAGLEMITRSA